MAIKTYKPVTPSQRYITRSTFDEITKTKPERRLTTNRKRTGGRNNRGRITLRGRGGGAKQRIRNVDFRRNKHGIPAKVVAIEYDPIRSARLALLEYTDGERRYIVAPNTIAVGATIQSGPGSPPRIGNCMPLKDIPMGLEIHNIELTLGKGGQLVRSAGGAATLMSRNAGFAQIKLPSGEIRRINENCIATIGQVGNTDHENQVWGKAGNTRHRGRRPITRAVAKNPHDHPMGGGEAKTSGGGHPSTPWGKPTKGFKTRKRKKYSNKFILVRRNGRPMKQR
jgi:large subunit ribosomal protein L2